MGSSEDRHEAAGAAARQKLREALQAYFEWGGEGANWETFVDWINDDPLGDE